jgi:hypothetical protein
MLKRDIVSKAFEAIGLGAYDFDLRPEDLQSGLEWLDLLVAEWAVKGIRIGATGGEGNGSIDEEAGVAPYAAGALIFALAIRIAPGYGKMVSAETKQVARESYDALLAQVITPRKNSETGYAGNGRYIRMPTQPLQLGKDGGLELG